MTVAEKLASWLDEIGADGLMLMPNEIYFPKENMDGVLITFSADRIVPAYRHADGSYHTEPSEPFPCSGCRWYPGCEDRSTCETWESWLSHKEAK